MQVNLLHYILYPSRPIFRDLWRSNFLSYLPIQLQVIAGLLPKLNRQIGRKRASQKLEKWVVMGIPFILIFCSVHQDLAAKQIPLQKKTEQLHNLKKNIQSLKQTISNARDKRETLYEELKRTDIQVGENLKTLAKLNKNLQTQKDLLHQLKNKTKQREQYLQKQQALLIQQIRAAYQLGQHSYIKLLLNQKNPNTIYRLSSYYKYFNKARLTLISDIQNNLNSLLTEQQNIEKQTKALQPLLTQYIHKKNHLEEIKSYHQQVIHFLNTDIQNKSQHLKESLKNKKSLELILSRLQHMPNRYSWKGKSFRRMKSHLSWPTKGTVIKTFRSSNGKNQLHYNGVFIKAPTNQPVHAIYSGKIIFADWLRGFGLLLIIEHAHGYMSLYAHNYSLYQKVGDYVATGDLIARVGHSGGNNNSGLYFEIRHKGKPLNPQKWCARKKA